MSLKVGVIGYSGNIENEPVKSLIDVCLELGERLGENTLYLRADVMVSWS